MAALAVDPPPPVRQDIGLFDAVFNDFNEQD